MSLIIYLFHQKKLCSYLPKIQTKKPNLNAFPQKDANGIANSVDPDQTAPLGAVWSRSAQTYLSKNLGSLEYLVIEEDL